MVDEKKAIFTIGVAAQMLDVHPRTLRIYEEEGLITPMRKGKWRYYTMDDIKWIECLREMIHEHGISIAALKKLLLYTLEHHRLSLREAQTVHGLHGQRPGAQENRQAGRQKGGRAAHESGLIPAVGRMFPSRFQPDASSGRRRLVFF